MATVIPIGEPANQVERRAIAHLRDHLPKSYLILHNFEIKRGDELFEIDLAIIARTPCTLSMSKAPAASSTSTAPSGTLRAPSNSALVSELTRFVREMRHGAFSILVASQDPVSVPVQLIELSSQIILHRFNSPAWLKHIQKANAALGSLTPEKMAHLRPGEAYIWSSKATDEAFSKGAIKVTCRPRVTQHGGATKTAVE